jgi:Mg-chelatase subunit ChlI
MRSEIVTRRLAFDNDPVKFNEDCDARQKILREQVAEARKRLGQVEIADEIIQSAVELATSAGALGHRAELALVRAARALAALMERDSVTRDDLAAVSAFALAHRFPGASVLSEAEVRNKLAGALQKTTRDQPVRPGTACDAEDFPLLENMDFPGSAAAGGMLFTYLKKKLKTATSASTNR